MLCPLIPFDSSLSFSHLVREDTLVSEQETPVCVCVCGGGGVSDGGIQVCKPSPDKYSSYLIHGNSWCMVCVCGCEGVWCVCVGV